MTHPAPTEHPLLGMPRRDAVTTLVLSSATTILFVLMAFHAPRSAIQRVDDRWLQLMLDARSSTLTAVAKVFNVLGLVYVTWPVRVTVAVFIAVRRKWWHLAAFVSAVVLSEVAIGTLKGIYDRPRPPNPLVEVTGGSFPSGHAVASSAMVVAIVIALFPEGPRRYWWGALAVLFSLAMGLSRTYLAAHWLSDSVGGVLLGTSIALGTALVVHSIRERRSRRASAGPPDRVTSEELPSSLP